MAKMVQLQQEEKMAVAKGTTPLAAHLDLRTKEGELYERLEGNKVHCYACGHRCLILDGYRGICKVRYNEGGVLKVPAGYVAALQCDPIEKKPFFHVLPGSFALTFGMLGCDYHCSYCQNWLTSQTLRDASAGVEPQDITSEGLVTLAKRLGARMVTSSYNEPLITSEWAVEVFKQAKAEGLLAAYVSNGNATPEVLAYLRPWTDCYKVDLKSMSDKSYRALGGKLSVVLETIPRLVEMGFWVEVVTLIIPGWNDSERELREAAQFIAGVSPDLPWHVTAFHKDYRMQDPDDTGPRGLIRAAQIGFEVGLRYVYAGNIPGGVGNLENTYCPSCKTLLVERVGFRILKNLLADTRGRCPKCSNQIPGIWT